MKNGENGQRSKDIMDDLFLNNDEKHQLEKKLKPCPFCGWKTIIITHELIPSIKCVRCNGAMIGYIDVYETVEMWNKRKRKSFWKKS